MFLGRGYPVVNHPQQAGLFPSIFQSLLLFSMALTAPEALIVDLYVYLPYSSLERSRNAELLQLYSIFRATDTSILAGPVLFKLTWMGRQLTSQK